MHYAHCQTYVNTIWLFFIFFKFFCREKPNAPDATNGIDGTYK